MKSSLSFLIFFVAASQAADIIVNITVFYESLSNASATLFRDTLVPAIEFPDMRYMVAADLIPFGNANFTEDPFEITCENGPLECQGNLMHACFIAKNPDVYEQIHFISCTMEDPDPASAGERCATELGYDFDGIPECMNGTEGVYLQTRNAQRTLEAEPPITDIPTMFYTYEEDGKNQTESGTGFLEFVTRKLKELGIYV